MENQIVTVDVLKNENELWAIENAFLSAVGEEPMSKENLRRLLHAVEAEQIFFFAARMKGQIIGMCSVSPCFSTFACKTCGVFDDFFVMPEYRGGGIARKLTETARAWCRARGFASLTVGCSQKDAFDTELGVMLANNL